MSDLTVSEQVLKLIAIQRIERFEQRGSQWSEAYKVRRMTM